MLFQPPHKYTQLETTWQDDNIKQKIRDCNLSFLTFLFQATPWKFNSEFSPENKSIPKGKSSFNYDFSGASW